MVLGMIANFSTTSYGLSLIWLQTKIPKKKHWARKAKWVKSHKKARLVGADWEQLGTVQNNWERVGRVESRTKEADMAIGVCRQCLLFMATHTRHSTTACSTTPARVHSTAPRAHTLPVPSRTAPCTPPVLSRKSSPLLPCARHALVLAAPLQSAVRLCRFAALLPSVVPFTLHRSRPSLARCCAAFLPPVSIAAAQCPHEFSSPSALELHYKDSPASQHFLQFYFLSPRHSIRCCRSRSCNS